MVMNVLYRGFIAELGILYRSFDTPVLPVVPLCIYQVGQQLIRCVIIRFTRFHAAFEGMEHAEELHLPQFVQCTCVHVIVV
jgi:hypothetical protein